MKKGFKQKEMKNKRIFKGYDIVSNKFFDIEEDNDFRSKNYFDNFEEFYNNARGDIYENSCYAFYDFGKNKDFIQKNNIDVERLKLHVSFEDKTIDDLKILAREKSKTNWTILATEQEYKLFNEIEQQNSKHRKWVEKFLEVTSYADFQKMYKRYNRSTVFNKFSENEIIDIYLQVNAEKYSDIVFSLLLQTYISRNEIYRLCYFYDIDHLLDEFSKREVYHNATFYKKKRWFKEINEQLEATKTISQEAGYEENTHYYYVKFFICGNEVGTFKFLNFDSFKKALKNDLSYADLSSSYGLTPKDIENCILNDTKLPFSFQENFIESIEKRYDNGLFYYTKYLYDDNRNIIKKLEYRTRYLPDYVFFLKNNLDDGDFYKFPLDKNIFLKNGISIENALFYDEKADKENFSWLKNKNTQLLLESKRAETSLILCEETHNDTLSNLEKCKEIHYVTDLHLDYHFFKECSSFKEVNQWCENNALNESSRGEILLIGGDVSSNFPFFVNSLKHIRKNSNNIFVLGNHEYWPFPGQSINEIVKIYKEAIEKQNDNFFLSSFLLHNNLLYLDLNDHIHEVTTETLLLKMPEEILEIVANSKLLFFGGTGFSGYNEKFNADNGVYNGVISREQEIEETLFFEKLYKKLLPVFEKKSTIILTHMPMKDWSKENYHPGIYYVSGHTHKNYFLDDGYYHVYEDGQCGYEGKICDKCFIMDQEYDYFENYKDGVYEITREQYENFNKGINNWLEFKREVKNLYMLKKNGYYCFMFRGFKSSKIKEMNNKLYLLNSKGVKALKESDDPQYYWDRMDKAIAVIKSPLDKYFAFQKIVSNEVKKIGGMGTIHGCIIDINPYNHLYVNPIDLTITPYYAIDMINKIVYPNTKALLEEREPTLYIEYKNQKQKDKNNLPVLSLKQKNVKKIKYLSTDIYKASREIKKMQNVYKNVLTYWPEDIDLENSSGICLGTNALIKVN